MLSERLKKQLVVDYLICSLICEVTTLLGISSELTKRISI